MQRTTFSLIQGLRFLAAISVLLFHLEISYSGYKGVDLFFVISGFVIYYSVSTNQFKGEQQKRNHFLINRLTKIFLLYWTSLLILFFIAPYPIDKNFAAVILLLPGHKTVLGISWTLSCELYFYFLFFLSMFIRNKKLLNCLFWLLFVIATVNTLLLYTPYSFKGSWYHFLFGQNLWEFLLGVIAAVVYLKHPAVPKKLLIMLLIIAVFSLILISVQYTSATSYFVYGFISFVLVLTAALAEAKIRWPLQIKSWVNRLGDASYAVYLFSPVVIKTLVPHAGNAVIILTVITLSLLINNFYENPLLGYVRKKIRAVFKK